MDWNEKELIQKDRESQQTVKSKKWIQAKKIEASRAKNLNNQSRAFFTLRARKTFTKLKQMFVNTPILNHFDLEHYIEIETNTLGYTIDAILSQLISDDLG